LSAISRSDPLDGSFWPGASGPLNPVVAEWLRRIPEFEPVPGYQPEIEWPSATSTLPEPPLRFVRT
jgi:hypothetical protein